MRTDRHSGTRRRPPEPGRPGTYGDRVAVRSVRPSYVEELRLTTFTSFSDRVLPLSELTILDTSILVEILDVPDRNANRTAILKELNGKRESAEYGPLTSP